MVCITGFSVNSVVKCKGNLTLNMKDVGSNPMLCKMEKPFQNKHPILAQMITFNKKYNINILIIVKQQEKRTKILFKYFFSNQASTSVFLLGITKCIHSRLNVTLFITLKPSLQTPKFVFVFNKMIFEYENI